MPTFLELGRGFMNTLGVTTPGQHDEAFQAKLDETRLMIEHFKAGGTPGVEGAEEFLEAISRLSEWEGFVATVLQAKER